MNRIFFKQASDYIDGLQCSFLSLTTISDYNITKITIFLYRFIYHLMLLEAVVIKII